MGARQRRLFTTEAYNKHHDQVHRVLRRLVGPGSSADDLTQECFITLHRKAESLLEHPNLVGWLCLTARQKARNHLRTAWLRLRSTEPLEEPATVSDTDLVKARSVHRCLQQLPLAQREVLVLCVLEGFSAVEVSQQLSISENTIRSRIKLAKKAFKKYWADQISPAEESSLGLDGVEHIKSVDGAMGVHS